jgi:hypothetical protein
VSAATALADSAVVLNPLNGHYYQRIDGLNVWDDARELAGSMSHNGLAGHLLTLTSSSELSFVLSNLGGEAVRNHWLGGFQQVGSAEPGGGWRWVTTEPFGYTNWHTTEPNNNFNGQAENALEFIGTPHPLGRWNDAYEFGAKGWMVEFEAVAGPRMITFDEQPASTLVTGQYAAQGAHFSHASFWEVRGETFDGNVHYPSAQSGAALGTGVGEVVFRDPADPTIRAVTGSFSFANLGLTSSPGAFLAGMSVVAYGVDGQILDTETVAPAGPNATRNAFTTTLTGAGIHRVTFERIENPFAPAFAAIDNVSFDALTSAFLEGDFNLDKAVTNVDIQAMLDALTNLDGYQSSRGLSDSELRVIGDIDHNGAVANADIQALLNLLTGGGSAAVRALSLEVFGDESYLDAVAASVPEPGTLMALATGAGIVWTRRRPR